MISLPKLPALTPKTKALGAGVLAILVTVLVVQVCCTPAERQQAAQTMAPIVGAVVCQQVVEEDGRQVCQVTADALTKLLPLLRLSEAKALGSAGECPLVAGSAVRPPDALPAVGPTALASSAPSAEVPMPVTSSRGLSPEKGRK